MISFKPLDPDENISVAALFPEGLSEGQLEEACETVKLLLECMREDAELEYGVTSLGSAILVRQYDGEDYSFSYPIALDSDADGEACLYAIADYAVKERLPLYLFDVPTEGLAVIGRLFKNFDVRLDAGERDRYSVYVYNELAFLDRRLPILPLCAGITEMTEVLETDAEQLWELNNSPEINEFWGYDYREDAPNATPLYFYDVCEYEREMRLSVTFALRCKGEYVGEALLSCFNFRGGCEVAIRLLPEHLRRGHGSDAFEMLTEVAVSLGVTDLYATVVEDNIPSLALFSHRMEEISHSDGLVKFHLSLC